VHDTAPKAAQPDSVELRGGTPDRIVTIADPAAADYGVTFSSKAVRDLAQLAAHARLAAEGRLRIPVAEVFPLADAGRAQHASEHGHAPGKLVLRP
ncbi:zinc-binding dehydrogenase, partial [Streptomyces sp. NPDC058953]|uniref:zinc-binding dehydrogenase n=1 Tax=Streptomyces sp. NPDC058953 TaxID=3346676 RepID=UPI0036CCE777